MTIVMEATMPPFTAPSLSVDEPSSPHDPSFFALMDDMDVQIPHESEEENKDNEASDYDDDAEEEEEYLMVLLT
jgi:hypothetical protein